MTPQTRTSLKELQQLDQEIAAVRSATQGFEPLLEEVDEPVLRLEQEVQALEKRLTEIRLEENRIELTIEERRARAAKLQKRMDAVRNVREEAAVHAELDAGVREAVQMLRGLVSDPDAPLGARVRAATALMDRQSTK